MCELTSEIYFLWKMLKLFLVEMYVEERKLILSHTVIVLSQK